MSLESIKDKIAKLLAKAEGTDNAAEAATFMDKVNALLNEHQIEMHEIRQRMGNKADADPIGKQKGATNIYASMSWARNVAGALARFYGCRFVYWKTGNHVTYEIVGRLSAAATFELMLPFVITQVKLQARKLDSGVYNDRSRSVLERQVGLALEQRIWQMTKAAEAERVVLTGKGLVPFDNLDVMMGEFYPKLRVAKNSKRSVSIDRDAWDAAKNININVQVNTPVAKRIGSN